MELPLLVLAAAVVVGAALLARRLPAPGAGEISRRLAEEAEATRLLLARAEQQAGSLAHLAGSLEERRRRDEEVTQAVRSVERLIAGSFSKGRAGENLLAAALSEFPPGMVVRDFAVGGRVCEFGLRLSDDKLLPVDSKWAAFDLVAELEAAPDAAAREEVRRRIERKVMDRLEEIARYLEPSLTAPLAVAAVPDAVYACCRRAHAAAKDLGVVIVSYSLSVPVLLGLWQLHRTYSREVDTERLLSHLHQAAVCLRQLGERIETQLSRGLTMAANAADQMRILVSSGLASIAAIERSERLSDEGEREERTAFG